MGKRPAFQPHPAFLPPPCCANRVQSLLYSIEQGGGEIYLGSLCHDCRAGKGIAFDFVDANHMEEYQMEELRIFGNVTGFRPTLITTYEERARHVAQFLERHPQPIPGMLQSELWTVLGTAERGA